MRTITNEGLINPYLEWLCNVISVERGAKSYWRLASLLFNTEFYWTVPNDDNRAEDGKKLREEYLATRPGRIILDDTCSILEMLVALAIRIEDILWEPGFGDRTSYWFWMMIRNLGLNDFDDDYYFLSTDERIVKKLRALMDREFLRTGDGGGLFPLKHKNKDQRKVEIWYQMMAYLSENFDI